MHFQFIVLSTHDGFNGGGRPPHCKLRKICRGQKGRAGTFPSWVWQQANQRLKSEKRTERDYFQHLSVVETEARDLGQDQTSPKVQKEPGQSWTRPTGAPGVGDRRACAPPSLRLGGGGRLTDGSRGVSVSWHWGGSRKSLEGCVESRSRATRLGLRGLARGEQVEGK